LYPQDGVADSGVITAALKERAAAVGTRFVYHTAVTAISD
jgi:hypothetical protein